MSFIEEFVIQYGAQIVTHAALIQEEQTIVLFPNEKQKNNYRTKDTLFTFFQVPSSAIYTPQKDLNGILYLEEKPPMYDVIPGEQGFVKRTARKQITQLTDCMVGEERIYHLPKKSRIHQLIHAIKQV